MKLNTHYDNLNNDEKIKVLSELYCNRQLSWSKVAEELDITVDKARKQAKKLGIKSRDKREAQRVALKEGRSVHRTAGRKRRPDEKIKISEAVGKYWDGLSEEELEYKRQLGRQAWESKTEAEKEDIRKKSSQSLNVSSKYGSKLERFLLKELIKEGYKVDFHKTYMLRNRNLTIDLLIPSISTAIEIDGPNHFEPIWGEEDLKRTMATDQQKTGLILSENLCLVRVRQEQKLTQRYMRKILNDLVEILTSISESFPPKDKRYFQI